MTKIIFAVLLMLPTLALAEMSQKEFNDRLARATWILQDRDCAAPTPAAKSVETQEEKLRRIESLAEQKCNKPVKKVAKATKAKKAKVAKATKPAPVEVTEAPTPPPVRVAVQVKTPPPNVELKPEPKPAPVAAAPVEMFVKVPTNCGLTCYDMTTGYMFFNDKFVESMQQGGDGKPMFDKAKPVYVACGEKTGFVGNRWLQHTVPGQVYDMFEVSRPVGNSRYYTWAVPPSIPEGGVQVMDMNLTQLDAEKQTVAWIPLHLFTEQLQGKYQPPRSWLDDRSAIKLPLRSPTMAFKQ